MAMIERWEVESPAFWEETGSAIAWRTLAITTLCLLLSFSTWFVMSAGLWLKSVPVKTSFRDQLDIFREKHTWLMTMLYMMTFGSFSGFSAAFPLMINTIYGSFPDAPDALKYAFYGPLIGSLVRVIGGPLSDRSERAGSMITAISAAGLIVCGIAVIPYLNPASLEQFPGFVKLMLAIFFFAGIGNASTFRQIPVIFSGNPRQGAGVLGWTAAVAAYGPFIFAMLIGTSISNLHSAKYFFFGAIAFYAVSFCINYWYYLRPGAERPC